MELPELTQQPVLLVDGTPDEGYPLRILRAYRQQCDCRWADTTTDAEPQDPVLKLMNEHCEQRAVILDRAIAILESSRQVARGLSRPQLAYQAENGEAKSEPSG